MKYYLCPWSVNPGEELSNANIVFYLVLYYMRIVPCV